MNKPKIVILLWLGRNIGYCLQEYSDMESFKKSWKKGAFLPFLDEERVRDAINDGILRQVSDLQKTPRNDVFIHWGYGDEEEVNDDFGMWMACSSHWHSEDEFQPKRR